MQQCPFFFQLKMLSRFGSMLYEVIVALIYTGLFFFYNSIICMCNFVFSFLRVLLLNSFSSLIALTRTSGIMLSNQSMIAEFLGLVPDFNLNISRILIINIMFAFDFC